LCGKGDLDGAARSIGPLETHGHLLARGSWIHNLGPLRLPGERCAVERLDGRTFDQARAFGLWLQAGNPASVEVHLEGVASVAIQMQPQLEPVAGVCDPIENASEGNQREQDSQERRVAGISHMLVVFILEHFSSCLEGQ
jgi:hypothetical protein